MGKKISSLRAVRGGIAGEGGLAVKVGDWIGRNPRDAAAVGAAALLLVGGGSFLGGMDVIKGSNNAEQAAADTRHADEIAELLSRAEAVRTGVEALVGAEPGADLDVLASDLHAEISDQSNALGGQKGAALALIDAATKEHVDLPRAMKVAALTRSGITLETVLNVIHTIGAENRERQGFALGDNQLNGQGASWILGIPEIADQISGEKVNTLAAQALAETLPVPGENNGETVLVVDGFNISMTSAGKSVDGVEQVLEDGKNVIFDTAIGAVDDSLFDMAVCRNVGKSSEITGTGGILDELGSAVREYEERMGDDTGLYVENGAGCGA